MFPILNICTNQILIYLLPVIKVPAHGLESFDDLSFAARSVFNFSQMVFEK